MRRFIAALLARRTADDRRAEYTYLALILLWHCVVFYFTGVMIDWWLGYGSSSNGRPISQPFDWNRVWPGSVDVALLALAAVIVLVFIEGLLGWFVFRNVNRRHKPDSRLFIRMWWRTCLWGTIGVPAVCIPIAAISLNYEIGSLVLLFAPILLALGPAWLAKAELRPRRTRWRPKCPECGYSLRGLTEPRCPECGVSFPTESRTFRRWAFRRLAWDRIKRGGLLGAYVKSLAAIVFEPERAARGLAVPDRWKRCIRWASAHILLAVVAATLLSNGQEYVRWTAHLIRPPTFVPPHMPTFMDPPMDRVILWAAQSFIAWLLPLLLAMGIACAVSYYTPGRHRVAKLGGLKWSLYLTVLFEISLAGWYGYYFIFPPQQQAPLMTFVYRLPPPEIPLWLLIVPYGVWWAIGMAGNQYNRRRNWIAGLVYAMAFFGLWLLTTQLLLAPGPLEALL